MIKKVEDLTNERYLITASLLNSWAYIWECKQYVREAESDTICYEDKITDAMKKAYDDFLITLNRIKTEPNEAMLRGIEFEDECYKGNTPVSPIIENGAYQIVGTKDIKVKDLNILLYGRLDVLKGGIVYDIKRVRQYAPQKYLHSYQHGMYLDLFENAYKFEYLAYDDKDVLHHETYYRDEYRPTKEVVKDFLNWLEKNNLLKLYKEKWRSK